MTYGRHQHLELPTVERLARHADGDLSAAARGDATDLVPQLQKDYGRVDVYRLHAYVHQQHPEATIAQIARFLLDQH